MAENKSEKILLAQLNSNGDCLYATVIAKQIKEVDYKGSHLTWAVNSKCKQSVSLNPYVDEIWEIPTKSSVSTYDEWEVFLNEAERRKAAGEFDKIFYTQIIGKGTMLFDGGIRSTIYQQYPHKITVSQEPIIRLSDDEVASVRSFSERNNLSRFKDVILMECGPNSFQSALNPQSASEIADKITEVNPSLAIILSSNKKVENPTSQIIDGSELTFRENAELTKYCTLFAGCSSGISWLTTTDWAKPLPKVIVVNHKNYYNSSMMYDHKYAGLPVNDIIELKECVETSKELHECLTLILKGLFPEAKKRFHADFRLTNFKFLYDLTELNKQNGDHIAFFSSIGNVIKRNGFRKEPILLFLKMFFKMPKYMIKFKKRADTLINK